MTAPANAQGFLQVVLKSGLLAEDALSRYAHYLELKRGSLGQPRDLAKQMVADGLITKFHAEQLLIGKYRGFTLGKYLILERLASGGMGTVFLAAHQSLKRRVAIKVLPPNSADDPVSVERFTREARAAALLDHANIARAHDVDCHGKHHFLVMEFVDGVTLHELVKKHGPLAPEVAAQYIRQAALGLAHAHGKHLVHRDIKPGNLMLTRQGVVKLLDMGLARFFQDTSDALTQNLNGSVILGTVDYIAPEQALNSHEVDIRADIYSLGATLYYLLTGRPPYGDGLATQKLLWHQMRPIEDVRTHQPKVPAGLAAVVAHMLEKDPAQRFQTPLDVFEALAAFAAEGVFPPPEKDLPRFCRAAEAGGPAVPAAALQFAPKAASPLQASPPSSSPDLLHSSSKVVALHPTASSDMDWEEQEVERPRSNPKGWLILGGVVVVLLLGTIGFFSYWQLAEPPPPPTPVAKETWIEGESLQIFKQSHEYPIDVQQMAGFPASKWSGNAQLWARPNGEGEWADLRFTLAASGRYVLKVVLTKAQDYGIVEFSLKGQRLGNPIDAYLPDQVSNTGLITLGTVDLERGVVVIRVSMVGANPRSVGARFMWGIDCFVLDPVP